MMKGTIRSWKSQDLQATMEEQVVGKEVEVYLW